MFGQTNDYEVPESPSDGISSLSWSPKANFLVSGSWDNKVRCWEVQHSNRDVMAQPRAELALEAPVLSTCWSGDGTKVFVGTCDNKVVCWSMGNPTPQPVGMHSAPVRTIHWIEEISCVATGSWDKTLKYWDLRQPKPLVADITLSERVYAMDVKYPLAVVGTADRQVYIYDLKNNPQKEYKKIVSPLKLQTRCVSCFPNSTGFAIGSIEGRVGIQYVQEETKNFAFKCHRTTDNNTQVSEVYSVNSISFHPKYGTFSTTGSDGGYHFWDKDAKCRLKQFPSKPAPIPVGVFNGDGSLFSYAVSYDWSKGSEFYNPTARNIICIKPVQDDDIKPKKKK